MSLPEGRSIVVALLTPFDDRGRLDEAALRAHVDDVVEAGDLVVAVCDSAHESLATGAGSPRLHWSVPDPVRVGTDAAFEAAYADLAGRVDRLAHRTTTPDENVSS